MKSVAQLQQVPVDGGELAAGELWPGAGSGPLSTRGEAEQRLEISEDLMSVESEEDWEQAEHGPGYETALGRSILYRAGTGGGYQIKR